MKTILCFILLSTCVYVLTVGTAFAEEKGCRYLYDKGEKKAYINCLKTNCDKGVLRACGDLGLAYNIKDLYISDEKKVEGINILESSCEQKDGASCFYLLSLYIMPQSGHYNLSKGMIFAKKGCDLEIDNSCRYVIALALQDRKSSLTTIQRQHEEYVFNLSQKMSAKNIPFSDYNYRLGMFYLYGETIKHDTFKALEAFKKGCDLQEEDSCNQMSQIYTEGKLVKKDLKMAEEFTKRGNDAKTASEEYFKQKSTKSQFPTYY